MPRVLRYHADPSLQRSNMLRKLEKDGRSMTNVILVDGATHLIRQRDVLLRICNHGQ